MTSPIKGNSIKELKNTTHFYCIYFYILLLYFHYFKHKIIFLFLVWFCSKACFSVFLTNIFNFFITLINTVN